MAYKVEFRKSQKTLEWDNRFESILELAEENGVNIDFECRQGYCGTCKTKLLSGTVDMESEEGLDEDEKEEGFILLCVALPHSDIVLDA